MKINRRERGLVGTSGASPQRRRGHPPAEALRQGEPLRFIRPASPTPYLEGDRSSSLKIFSVTFQNLPCLRAMTKAGMRSWFCMPRASLTERTLIFCSGVRRWERRKLMLNFFWLVGLFR